MKSFNYKEICGCIHLHTTFSDGGVTYEELIAAAQNVDIDYVVVTDHMTMRGLESGFEGIHGNLLVLVGYEHNDSHNRNHYLVLGTDKVLHGVTRPQEYINAVKAQGGVGFLAHPAEKRNYFGKLPPYPWTEWGVEGFDGIELWNQMSDWIEQLKNLRSFIRLFFPRRYLGNVPKELLNKWDDLNRTCFVSGIGGVDAHTRKLRFGPFSYTVFPIKVELKGIRTHLYIKQTSDGKQPNPKKARESLLSALKNGNGFISNYRHGDARGAEIFLLHPDGQISIPGCPAHKVVFPITLIVKLPGSAEICLVRNGKTVQSTQGRSAEFILEDSGIYRIEVLKRNNVWIYSNPFPLGSYPFDV